MINNEPAPHTTSQRHSAVSRSQLSLPSHNKWWLLLEFSLKHTENTMHMQASKFCGQPHTKTPHAGTANIQLGQILRCLTENSII